MVVHDDLLVIIVLKQMKIARWGCESARACTRTRREPRVCHLHAYHARQGPVQRAESTRHDHARDNSQVPDDNPSFCWEHSPINARKRGFGGNHGNSGEVGRIFPWFGREDRAPREPVGFVAMYVPWWVRRNYWYFGAGAKFWPYRPVRGAGAKHRSTTSERRR